VFVDKSVIEIFANSRQAIARRIFPEKADSAGVKVFTKGSTVEITKFKSWQIAPSNPY
jgi:beta-fructofuranosidase